MSSTHGLLKTPELLKAEIDAAVLGKNWLEAHRLEQELRLVTEAIYVHFVLFI